MSAGDGGRPRGRDTAAARRWEAAGLLLIVFVAAALRLYRLPELPPGLHYDEAFNGISARDVLQSGPRIFFASDMGEEPLAIHLVALALALLGQEPWIIRLTSALAGVLTVPLAWWLGRGLAGQPAEPPATWQAPATGLGTALVLAILYWHVSFSRIGMEPILVPLFATLAFAALLHGLNTPAGPAQAARPAGENATALPARGASVAGVGHRRRGWAFGLAGLALGGSLYTYKAGYFVPVVAAAWVAYAALVERDVVTGHRRGLLLAAAVALVVATPIAVYFATHPEDLTQRPGSVALVAEGEAPAGAGAELLANLPRVLGGLFLRGDGNPRSNLPGRPALDPFLAALFLLGLARAVARCRRSRAMLPAIWLAIMLVPTLVTEHAPHFGRAIGAVPALAALCAGGGCWLLELAAGSPAAASRGNHTAASRHVRLVAPAILLLGLAFSAGSTARDYFVTWGGSPALFYAYDVGLARVAGFVDTVPAEEEVYLTPTPREHYTLRFLVDRPWASYDGRAGQVFPPPGRAATVVVILAEDQASLPALRQARPDGRVTWSLEDGDGRPYAAAYRLPARDEPAPAAAHRTAATLGGAARLLGYSLDREQAAPGDTVQLVLYWQALAPLPDDFTVFTHVLGDQNPATGSPVWAGHDGQPDGGHYPTSAWRRDEVILDVHPLAIPAGAPPGDYQLEAGLYLLATMERLPAHDAGGNRVPGDAVLLGTLRLTDGGGKQ